MICAPRSTPTPAPGRSSNGQAKTPSTALVARGGLDA